MYAAITEWSSTQLAASRLPVPRPGQRSRVHEGIDEGYAERLCEYKVSPILDQVDIKGVVIEQIKTPNSSFVVSIQPSVGS